MNFNASLPRCSRTTSVAAPVAPVVVATATADAVATHAAASTQKNRRVFKVPAPSLFLEGSTVIPRGTLGNAAQAARRRPRGTGQYCESGSRTEPGTALGPVRCSSSLNTLATIDRPG